MNNRYKGGHKGVQEGSLRVSGGVQRGSRGVTEGSGGGPEGVQKGSRRRFLPASSRTP
jgi:hypothetical protein